MNPRKPSVTAQDVARRAGVSRAVVSRALSNNGSISPDARARVLRAAEELGYQVNFLAQGLNRQRSHLIGVIVSRISDPFRSTLLDALLNEIQRQGFQALVSEIHSEQDLAQTLRRFAQFRVSGVIVTSGQPPEALVNECVQQHIPVVGINRQPTIPGVDYVCSDNAAGMNWPPTSCCAAAVSALAGSTTILPPGPAACAGSVRPGAANARSGRRTPRRSSPVSKKVTRAGYRLRRSPTRRWRDLLRQRPACLWLSRWNAPARQRGSGGFSADWF